MTNLMLIILITLSILWMLGWASVIISNVNHAFSQRGVNGRHGYLTTILIAWCLMGLLPVLVVIIIV